MLSPERLHLLCVGGLLTQHGGNHSLRVLCTLRGSECSAVLPSLLTQVEQVKMFFHDSEHMYENMMLEFDLSRGHSGDRGLLLVDGATLEEGIPRTCAKW